MLNITDIALLVTGTLTVPDDANPGQYKRIVIQRTRKGLGNVPTPHAYDIQVKDWKLLPDPKTPLKQAHRARFMQAVAAWHDATDDERKIGAKLAKKRKITLFNAWISLWIQSHSLPTWEGWDNGSSQWDAGLSIWDQATTSTWDAGATLWDNGTTNWSD